MRIANQAEKLLFRTSKMELTIGQFCGHYKILSLIGIGGMGEVYLAEDINLHRQVALKFLPQNLVDHSDRLKRFEREARAVSALNHPNILTIHEFGNENDLRFFAMEFVKGVNLKEKIETGPLPVSEALNIASQVAAALSGGHETGIIHRDIKPDNIMIRDDGFVKVLDFGIAKLTEDEDIHQSHSEAPTRTHLETNPGSVIGTANYMSPEQARGMNVDARTDIFSLGVVLYEMAAGRLPFEGSTASEVVASILGEKEPQPLARYSKEVPAELERIVFQGAAQKPRAALSNDPRPATRSEESDAGVGIREKAGTLRAAKMEERGGHKRTGRGPKPSGDPRA